MGRWMRNNWWVVLAGLLGTFEVVLGVGLPFEDRTVGSVVGGVFIASLGATMLVGIRLRRTRRSTGDAMIAIGTLPVYPFLWTVVLPLLGLAVLLPAIMDAADARSVGSPPVERTDDGERVTPVLLGLVLAAVAAAVAIGEAETAVFLVGPTLSLLLAHLALRSRHLASGLVRFGLTVSIASVGSSVITTLAVIVGGVELGDNSAVMAAVSGAGTLGLLALVVGVVRARTRTRPV